MANTLSIAASGLMSTNHYIDSIAHNIANANTPFYKAERTLFKDQILSEKTSTSSDPSKNLLGVSSNDESSDFTQGPLKPSSNWTDISINGEGFYQVTDSEGTILYTRRGDFILDEERYLCSHDGLRLADNIQIPDDASDITVQSDGSVLGLRGNDINPELIGNITLARFSNPNLLTPKGSGIYSLDNPNITPIIDTPETNGLGGLLQHQIESSNVDLVTTLMELTEAQRIYQMNAKALQLASDMDKIMTDIRE